MDISDTTLQIYNKKINFSLFLTQLFYKYHKKKCYFIKCNGRSLKYLELVAN